MPHASRTLIADIDENRSMWSAHKAPYDPLASLEGDARCNIAIIGGGFCGVSTALQLSERVPEKSIVLLEARSLANGASGRNGGLVLNWLNGIETGDLERSKLVYDTTREGIDLIEKTIRDNKLDVRFRRDGTLDVLTDEKRAAEAAADVETLAKAGIPLRFIDRNALPEHLKLEGAFGAIHDTTTGQLDGVDYLRALRPVLVNRGIRVHENTPVTSVEEGSTITLNTPKGRLVADAIVLATNAHTPNLGYFKHSIIPLHSHVIATERLPLDQWKEIGWSKSAGFSDDLDRIAYASMTRDGELVFGGGSNAAYSYVYGSRPAFRGSAERNFAAIRERLYRYLPKAREVKIAHQWTGAVAVTMSRVCAMGVMGEHRNVYYAVGFSGHGITLANLAGRVLADLYVGAPERWRHLPFLDQKLHHVPPEPFRWMGYHVMTSLTGRSPRKHI